MNVYEETDAILSEFAAETAPDLAAWSARYPQCGREFARLLTDRCIGLPEVSAEQTERVAGIGRQLLRERRAGYATAPLTGLKTAAESAGLSVADCAAALQIPIGLFWKLHRRLVSPESVPAALVARLSETLRRTEDELKGYFALPPTLAAGASYRADAAPAVGEQERFADALESDPDVTEAMRQIWRG